MAAEKDPHTPLSSASASSPGGRAPGPELRLLDRRAFIGFPPMEIAPGVQVTDFALQIPDVTFPFNVTGGPLRYQKKKLQFGYLDVTVDGEQIQRRLARVGGELSELDELKLHFRPGYLEGQARLKTAERTPVTFKVAFDGDGEKLAVYLYDVRLFSFSATPASQVPVLLSRALQSSGVLPEVELRGATGFTARVLPPLCQAAAVSRGFKTPLLDGARLSAAEVSPQGLKLRFSSGGLPPAATPDDDLMLTLEGARAFAEAEGLLARGKLLEARSAYLRHGDIQEAHPFAAERLLTLLVADPQAHEMALDVAASLSRRRDRSATALWAEAVVRERRGEGARAAERFLTLCGLSRRSGQDASAFFAAESAARAAREQAPQMAVKALHELLGLRPDHLPSLQALARSSDQANDRAGAARAYRRIAALARDPADAAEAHVHLARLSAQTEDDVAGARLHCEAALRLTPDHPEALFLLGELCHRSGEHLRALKALDRLRDVGLGRHELDRVGKAHLLAGQVWEEGLNQPENALLRYREAVALLPHAPEPLYRVARVAESLGRIQEALAGYQQTVELAGPGPRDEDVRRAAHGAHHALARLYRTKLSDPIQARAHLESALALDAGDIDALEELIPVFRNAGRSAELADALEKSAALQSEPGRRAAQLAEAGELFRARLGQAEKAERLLTAALDADPRQRVALEGILALAEARREGGPLSRSLKALADLSVEPKERARYLRRLAVTARDLTFDLELAAYALTEVLKVEPDDLAVLGELCALQRKRGDIGGLASALEQRARAAEANRDLRLAAAALRELAQVLEARLGRVGEALIALEKAARLAPDVGILSDLADLSLRCERPEHARRALEDLAAQLPKHAAPERVAEVKARLGRACEQLGDKAAARRFYAEAFPLRRLDDVLAGRLEALLQEDGAEAELGQLWAARADALLAAGRSEAAAPLLVSSAEALLRLGQRESALVKLGAALDAAPEGPHAADILDRMAEVALQVGTQVDAAKLYARKAGMLRDPSQAAALFWKAALLAVETPREEGYLDEVLANDPDHLLARIRRAQLLMERAPLRALDEWEHVLCAPASHPQAPSNEERSRLLKQASEAALRADRPERALGYLARYAAEHPEDLATQRQLSALLEREGRDEARCDLLAELWPRLSGTESEQACRDFCELALRLHREPESLDALRSLLRSQKHGGWAAHTLLDLLPVPQVAGDDADERRVLLSRVLQEVAQDAASEEARAWWLERAALSELAGQLGSARSDYALAAQHTPTAALWIKVANLSQQLGEAGEELNAWEQLLSLKSSSDSAGTMALLQPRLLALANERVLSRDLPRAESALRALLQLPLTPEVRQETFFGLAEVARLRNDPAAQAQALGSAAEQGPAPRRIAAYLEQASLLEAAADNRGTLNALEAALRLSPGHPQATQALVRGLRRQEDWSGLAEALAAQAKALSGAEAAALYEELAHLYQDRLHQPGPAEAAWVRVAALDPRRSDVQVTLLQLAMARGDLAEATARGRKAIAGMSSTQASSLLLTLAHAAEGAGDPERALGLERQAHALWPLQGQALSDFALRVFRAGGWKEAQPLLREAARPAANDSLSDDPDREVAVLMALAESSRQLGDLEEAERALVQLQQSRPEFQPAAEQLASLYWSDRPREAVRVLRALAHQMRHGGNAATLLVSLADRARRELSDLELASELLSEAAEVSFDALPVREARAALLREAGRTVELMAELAQLAELREASGDGAGALAAHLERAELAESSGRVDEALRTLEEIRVRREAQGNLREAALIERRRAELFRDARHDLAAAQASLERSDSLFADDQTLELGIALARQLGDPRAEAGWLSRAAERSEGKAKAQRQLQLAKVLIDANLELDRADAAVRAALDLDPASQEAEALLLERLERSGKLPELAAYYEEAAARSASRPEKVALLVKAADVYAGPMARPELAASALLAAHASAPDDRQLTARAADLLHAVGRQDEAAEFDALLLDTDPFHAVSERHLTYLKLQEAHAERAGLLVRRASAQEGAEAARSFLAAAQAFRSAGATEQALLCEVQAFHQDPANDEAFAAARARQAQSSDVRPLADLLEQRAAAVPSEAPSLLKERAEKLADAGESLLAAVALDELLELTPNDLAALLRRGELAAQAGGPAAAQPYDRRALDAGDTLSAAMRSRLLLRLGHASLSSGAMQDAADAFDRVVTLDGEGERGQEALSLLAEVHARTQNVPGLYRTSLALAGRASPAEAEALLRRAAGLFVEPSEAIDAWLALAALRPRDPAVIDSAMQALRTQERWAELVNLQEESASRLDSAVAAQRLLDAAALAESKLSDNARARALRAKAFRADPANPLALAAVVEEARLQGDAKALRDALQRLIVQSKDQDDEALWRLELSSAHQQLGDQSAARDALWPIVHWGPSATGYAEALRAIRPLLSESDDASSLADVLSQLAELSQGSERAALLLEAAQVFERVGDAAAAVRLVQASVSGHATEQGFVFLAQLYQARGESTRAGEALRQAARLTEGPARGQRLLQAADRFEAGGQQTEAKECVQEAAVVLGEQLPARDLAIRLSRLGAAPEALAAGFDAALSSGALDEALQLAQAAHDDDRARAVLQQEAQRGESMLAERVLGAVTKTRNPVAVETLARLLDEALAVSTARTAWQSLAWGALHTEASLPLRRTALSALIQRDGAEALSAALASAEPAEVAWLEGLLAEARRLGPATLRAVLPRLRELLPDESDALGMELVELHARAEAWSDAVELLASLADQVRDEVGARWLRLVDFADRAGDGVNASSGLERALAEKDSAPEAARRLLSRASTPEALLKAADQAIEAQQASALVPYRAQLADVYEQAGRLTEAARALAELEPTRERLQQRARIADAQGHSGEALTLREQLTDDRVELEEILLGYLVRDLHPQAVRLARQLLQVGALSNRVHRAAAERLSRSPEGATLACELWPQLLRERLGDADSWTLFADALRNAQRMLAADRADGIGAALTGSRRPATQVELRPVVRGAVKRTRPLPSGAVRVTAEAMPRLFSALAYALQGLQAPEVQVWLDPNSGVGANLVQPDVMVLGLGALSVFGAAELTFLCGLVLAMGDQQFGLVEQRVVAAAVAAAFRSVPGTLAAARVVEALDPTALGADPQTYAAGSTLVESPVFASLAGAALDIE